MNRKMRTSVVIPTKNSIATIRQCLSSLMPYYEQGYIGEIVVVDAHSTDGTLDAVKSFPVKLLFHEGKGDYAYATREIGWRNAKEDFLLFIDNDAYLGGNFFPAIYQFFSDEKMGIVAAQQRAIVTNAVTKAIGEWWVYHAQNLRGLINGDPSSWSLFQRLYQRVAWGGEKHVTTSGPCYIVRRICIEAVNGFQPCQASEDIRLSRKIIEKGWKAAWWLDAPFYHRPAASLKHLIKQRLFFGRLDAAMHQGSLKDCQEAIVLVARLGTPLVGMRLAIRFKNPLHLILFPMAHYAWIGGYLAALVRRNRCERDI